MIGDSDARKQFTKNRKYSNFSITSKIDKNCSVIDVGCGANLFKEYFPDLIGIDPITDQADFKVTLQEFTTDKKFDAAICFGSMHFGTREDVEIAIAKLCSLLKPNAKIFWRCWCSVAANYEKVPFFYQWSFDDHHVWSKQFGFNLDLLDYDYSNQAHQASYRIYAEWSK